MEKICRGSAEERNVCKRALFRQQPGSSSSAAELNTALQALLALDRFSLNCLLAALACDFFLQDYNSLRPLLTNRPVV